MSKWISVKERLPKEGEKVLVYSRLIPGMPYITTDTCTKAGNFAYCGARGTVTHWMPLPEPPEEVDG